MRIPCIGLAAPAFLLTGCAFFNRQNTPLLNVVERTIVPKSVSMRVALAPVVIPIGITAGALDVFVVHPIMVVPDALRDTREALWKSRVTGYVTAMGSLIPRTAVTPVVFAGAWFGRSAFALPGRVDVTGIAAAIERDDLATVRQWLRDPAVRRGDASALPGLKAVIEKYPDEIQIQQSAFAAFLQSGVENEGYLLDLLRTEHGPREGTLVRAFGGRRSRAAGEIMLQKVFAEPMSADRAKLYLSAILQIGDQDQIRRLLERLRGTSQDFLVADAQR
jgi:hypothetical protein